MQNHRPLTNGVSAAGWTPAIICMSQRNIHSNSVNSVWNCKSCSSVLALWRINSPFHHTGSRKRQLHYGYVTTGERNQILPLALENWANVIFFFFFFFFNNAVVQKNQEDVLKKRTRNILNTLQYHKTGTYKTAEKLLTILRKQIEDCSLSLCLCLCLSLCLSLSLSLSLALSLSLSDEQKETEIKMFLECPVYVLLKAQLFAKQS